MIELQGLTKRFGDFTAVDHLDLMVETGEFFGLGIQTTSHGQPYLHFLIPGIVAMATMTGSFSAIAQNMFIYKKNNL